MRINQLTRYCQEVFQRIRGEPEDQTCLYRKTVSCTDHLISINAELRYHAKQSGFFTLIDDQGREFYPLNLNEFPLTQNDHQSLQVTLEYYPQLLNIYQYGISARLICVEKKGN